MNSQAQDKERIIFALWQMHSKMADFHANAQNVLEACQEAAAQGAMGLAAPLFCLGGHAPKHIRCRRDFLRQEQEAVQYLRQNLPDNFILILGSFTHQGPYAVVLGKETENANVFMHGDLKIKVMLLEEGGPNAEMSDFKDIDLFIVLGNEVYKQEGNAARNQYVRGLGEYAPVLYVNAAGGHGLIFEGQSQLIEKAGHFHIEPDFSQKLIFVRPFAPGENMPPREKKIPEEEFWLQALKTGVRDFVGSLGFSCVHLGLSGGIDSALVAAVAAEALGAENVMGILMSSRYSSKGSVEDALELAKNLGMGTMEIGIKEMHEMGRKVLGAHFPVEGLADENLQARIRGLFLMAYSNACGSLLLNTGNKSEMAVGYSTLYGDSCGALAVIGDLWKTQVYRLCRYINEKAHREIIPAAILSKEPSAELRADQKDRDSLPDYEILDDVLNFYLQKDYSKEDLLGKGYDEAMVNRLIKLFRQSAYKRAQAAPVICLSETAFGFEDVQFS